MSDTINAPQKNLLKAMLHVQRQLGTVQKSGKNSHLKSSYATLPDVLDELLPKCNEAGIVVIQGPSDSGMQGLINVETSICHAESGEVMRFNTPMPYGSGGAQAVGSAITYARRYALMSIFGLKAGDDDGEAATHQPQRQRESVGEITHRQIQQELQRAAGFGQAAGRTDLTAHNKDQSFHQQVTADIDRGARPQAMSQGNAEQFNLPPTDRQLDLLAQLRYDGEPPQTRAEASQIISRMKAERAG